MASLAYPASSFASNSAGGFRTKIITSARHAYDALPDARCTEHRVETADGLSLTMHRIIRHEERRPIVLFHGLTSTGEMFALPETYSLTQYLLDQGFGDIWIPEWRGSGVYAWSTDATHNVDDVALYDVPAILAAIRSVRPGSTVDIVAHCVGAMAVSMACVAGLLSGVNRFVCANVGLLPYLKGLSWAKSLFAPNLIRNLLKVDSIPIDPADMDLRSADAALRLMAGLSASTCSSAACRMISFAWGSGDEDTLYRHAHVHPHTHDRLVELFGPSALSYLHHIQRMMAAKAVVKQHSVSEYAALPNNYLNEAGRIRIPTLLIAGTENRCWYDSIPRYHDFLREYFPDVPVKLCMIDGYGHQDLIIGTQAAFDVFPAITDFLMNDISTA